MRLTSFRFIEDPELDEDGQRTPTRFGALVSNDTELCDLTASLPVQWGHLDALTFLNNGDDAFRRADEAIKSGKHRLALSSVNLLAPVVAPSQVICVANNYHPYVQEEDEEDEEGEEDEEDEGGEMDGSGASHRASGSANQSLEGSKPGSPASSRPHSGSKDKDSSGNLSPEGKEKEGEKKSRSKGRTSRQNSTLSATTSRTSHSSEGSDDSRSSSRAPGPEALQEEPVPQFFTKYISSVYGPESYAPKKDESPFTVGGELAVIIGRQCRRIREDEASDYIGGYTIGHDFAELDWTEKETRWLHGKAYDAPLLLGPAMVAHRALAEPMRLRLRTLVNGKEIQKSNTKHMKFDIGQLLQHVTRFMPLYPGDVVLTGRPPSHPDAPTELAVGDRVTVEMGEVGTVACFVAIEHDIDD